MAEHSKHIVFETVPIPIHSKHLPSKAKKNIWYLVQNGPKAELYDFVQNAIFPIRLMYFINGDNHRSAFLLLCGEKKN